MIRFCIFILFMAVLPFSAVFAQAKPDALAEYRAGNYERSVQICKDEITSSTGNLESHVVICWSLLQLERYDEAMRYARAGRTLSRYDVRITEILGEICYRQGKNSEALQYFQEYVNLSPEGQRIEMVYYFMGEIYIKLGKYRHADIAFSTAVHWMPGNALYWSRLAYAKQYAAAPAGQAQERIRDLTEAVTAYERALALNPQLNDARRGLEGVRKDIAGR